MILLKELFHCSVAATSRNPGGGLLSRFASSGSVEERKSGQDAFLDEDDCIVVDETDRILGTATKRQVHQASSVTLHRAFSVFAFTPSRQLIMQKRAASKVTFPSLWTNTCCSHPLYSIPEEIDMENGVRRAAVRKLVQELNLVVREEQLTYMGRFLYKAHMQNGAPWAEHEMDYALVLKDIPIEAVRNPNLDEVEQTRVVDSKELNEWLQQEPLSFSPWFILFHRLGLLERWWGALGDEKTLHTMKSNDIIKMD